MTFSGSYESRELRIQTLNGLHKSYYNSDRDELVDGIGEFIKLLKRYYPDSLEVEIYTKELEHAEDRGNIQELRKLFNKLYSVLYNIYTDDDDLRYRKKKSSKAKPTRKIVKKCKCK